MLSRHHLVWLGFVTAACSSSLRCPNEPFTTQRYHIESPSTCAYAYCPTNLTDSGWCRCGSKIWSPNLSLALPSNRNTSAASSPETASASPHHKKFEWCDCDCVAVFCGLSKDAPCAPLWAVNKTCEQVLYCTDDKSLLDGTWSLPFYFGATLLFAFCPIVACCAGRAFRRNRRAAPEPGSYGRQPSSFAVIREIPSALYLIKQSAGLFRLASTDEVSEDAPVVTDEAPYHKLESQNTAVSGPESGPTGPEA